MSIIVDLYKCLFLFPNEQGPILINVCRCCRIAMFLRGSYKNPKGLPVRNRATQFLKPTLHRECTVG